ANQRAKRLICADVGRRLFAPDVLLARGQRQDKRAAAFHIFSHADKTSWSVAHELFARCKKTEVRSAKIHRDAEGLSFADDDVRASWRFQDTQRDGLADV